MSLPQDFLRTGGNLDGLHDKYAITAKRHPRFNNLVMLKYNQIDSPMAEPLVQQCRGIILDEDLNWNVVARPFDKFFNYGEGQAATIDWRTAAVQEKLDGSLMILYYYDKTWQVASSGTPDAGGEVNGCGIPFADLFWSVFKEKGYVLPGRPFGMMTLMFELMTPYNRVVVSQKVNDLKLVGMRYNFSGSERAVRGSTQFEPVNEYSLSSLEQVIQTFETMDPLQQEGYVIVDGHFNRVKVKHPGYVALHHLKDGLNPKRLVDVVRRGETTEVLAAFPEWKPAVEQIQRSYDDLVTHLEVEYSRLKGITVQKDFALEAVKTRLPSALFMLRKGQVGSVKAHVAGMMLDHVVDVLGVRSLDVGVSL